MSVQIKMPALSSTHDEGKLAKWLIKDGQRVRSGDIIAEVETDEAVIEIEAVEEGTIRLLVPEGTAAVKVNTPIATLEQGAGGGRASSPNPIPAGASRLTSETPRSPAAPASPTVVIRTRFKSTLAPATGPTPASKPGATAMPTAAAPPSPAKTMLLRASAQDVQTDPVAGWLVVIKGPGRGGFRPIFVGMNSIGRDPGQRVSLSFGDDAISREEHAFVTYDEESRRFFIQHGGKANLIRLGAQPVLVPTELKTNDRIRIGKTTLRFVSCCGPDFTWSDEA